MMPVETENRAKKHSEPVRHLQAVPLLLLRVLENHSFASPCLCYSYTPYCPRCVFYFTR